MLGAGDVVGTALDRRRAVRAVSFTGSGRIGATVAAAAAARNIRYQTEMGGKNVAIVMPDADLRQAAALTAAGAMRYAGQKCTATSRVVVAREVEDAFLAELRAQVAALPLGPVTDAAAADRAGHQRPFAVARFSGRSMRWTPSASTWARFRRGRSFARGYFVAPTIVRGASPTRRIAQRELFGPVLASFVADDLDQAIAIANRRRYGLSASLFTRDLRERAPLHRPHRRRHGARERRHDGRRSARAVRRHEGIELRQSRAGSGGARVLHRDQDRTDQCHDRGAGDHSRASTRTPKASRRAWSSTGGRSRAGATMAERRDDLRRRSDHLRSAVVCEPRGHAAIVGALLTPPVNAGLARRRRSSSTTRRTSACAATG